MWLISLISHVHVYFYQVVLVVNIANWPALTYGKYKYPLYTDVIGWMITALVLVSEDMFMISGL